MPAILQEARHVFQSVAAEGGELEAGEVGAPPLCNKVIWLKGHCKLHRELDRLGVFRKQLLQPPPDGDGAYTPITSAFDQAQPNVLKQIKHTVFPEELVPDPDEVWNRRDITALQERVQKAIQKRRKQIQTELEQFESTKLA